MKRMLNVRTPYKRSDWYDGMRLDPGKDNVLSMRNDDMHGKLRSKMAAGVRPHVTRDIGVAFPYHVLIESLPQYSGKEVEDLEAKIDANVLRLIHLLDTKYIAVNKPFDISRKAQFFTLDVSSDLAFGEPLGDVLNDEDVYQYIQTMEENMPNIIVTTVLPWLLTIMSLPLFRSMIPSEKDVIGLGRTMACVFPFSPLLLVPRSLLLCTAHFADYPPLVQHCQKGRRRAVWTRQEDPKGHAWVLRGPWTFSSRGRV